MSGAITYAVENDLGADEFIDVLRRSTLAERRPVDERGRVEKMVAHANLIVTARDEGGKLIGVSRCLTDFAFCCYCSDLAVDVAHQKQGIGEKLLDESAARAGDHAHFFLISAPGAVEFYKRIGMRHIETAFDRGGWQRLVGSDS